MRPVPILHADASLVVVDKPPGVLVVAAAGRSGPTLTDLVSAQLGQRVLPVHRLDEDTTGCLVFALDDATRTALEGLFRVHAIERDYLALLTAVPSPEAGRIESNLEEGGDGVVRIVRRGGRRAVTHYETLSRRGKGCLVRCRLETGRRNQIRAHMAALGCPVVGDRKYGYRARSGERAARVLLHSWRIAFAHPVGGARVEAIAGPPEPELRP